MASVNLDVEGLPVLASQLQNDSPTNINRTVQLDSDSDVESVSSENQNAVAMPEENEAVWQAQQSSLLPIDLPNQEDTSIEEEFGATDEALQASLSHLLLRPVGSVGLPSHTTQMDVQAATSKPVEENPGTGDTAMHSLSPADVAPRRSMSELGAASSSGQLRAWETYSKHVLVLTSSGKPIYSLHGDPDSLAGLMALATALISVVADHGDKLQHILAGPTLIIFMSRGPIYLIATSRTGEPAPVLQRQLELVYRQIMLMVATGLERILTKNPAYDAQALVEGIGPMLNSLVTRMTQDPVYLVQGVTPLPLTPPDRAVAAQALADGVKSSGALYGLLIALGGHVVAIEPGASAKHLPLLDGSDVLVLDNFVMCNTAIRQGHGESFCPICLPAYSVSSFLHAYIHFFEPFNGGLYLVLLSASSTTFHEQSHARQAIERQLLLTGVMRRVQDTALSKTAPYLQIDSLPKPLGDRFGHTALWHFIVRLTQKRQVLTSGPCEALSSIASQQRLALLYARAHSIAWDHPHGSRPNKLVWVATDDCAFLAKLDAEVEVYLVADPLTDKGLAMRLADALKKNIMDGKMLADWLLPA